MPLCVRLRIARAIVPENESVGVGDDSVGLEMEMRVGVAAFGSSLVLVGKCNDAAGVLLEQAVNMKAILSI